MLEIVYIHILVIYKQTIVTPLYEHITSYYMTVPYSIMYVHKLMY